MATTAALSRPQVIFLQVLSTLPKGEGMTLTEVEESAGCKFSPGLIGMGTRPPEESPEGSLYREGHIRAEKQEEERAVRWIATASGRKLGEKIQTRHVLDGIKIPAPLLDRTVIQFAKSRTYGLESYTSEDCDAIRAKLGEKYSAVSDESLKQQMCNRRKQGAFRSQDDKRRTLVAKMLREFGKDGTVIPGFLSKGQIERLRAYERGEVESLVEDPT